MISKTFYAIVVLAVLCLSEATYHPPSYVWYFKFCLKSFGGDGSCCFADAHFSDFYYTVPGSKCHKFIHVDASHLMLYGKHVLKNVKVQPTAPGTAFDTTICTQNHNYIVNPYYRYLHNGRCFN